MTGARRKIAPISVQKNGREELRLELASLFGDDLHARRAG